MFTDPGYTGMGKDLQDVFDTPIDVPTEERNMSFADMVERLFREFEETHSLNEILEVARKAQDDLSDSPPAARPELVERLARQRLAE